MKTWWKSKTVWGSLLAAVGHAMKEFPELSLAGSIIEAVGLGLAGIGLRYALSEKK